MFCGSTIFQSCRDGAQRFLGINQYYGEPVSLARGPSASPRPIPRIDPETQTINTRPTRCSPKHVHVFKKKKKRLSSRSFYFLVCWSLRPEYFKITNEKRLQLFRCKTSITVDFLFQCIFVHYYRNSLHAINK